MLVFGFAGWSGSGKTTLIERLIPCLIAQGLVVSLVKHAHHEFDIDRAGKDSHRHREAGCQEVLVTSAVRWALMHELHGEKWVSLGFSHDRVGDPLLVLRRQVFSVEQALGKGAREGHFEGAQVEDLYR